MTAGASAVPACDTGAADIVGAAAGSFGAAPVARSGTVSPVAVATSCVAGVAVAGGAACSCVHAMYNSVATTSQAKIRKVRVWFMDCAISGQPGIVPVGAGGGNAPARRRSASNTARSCAFGMVAAGLRATTT